MRIVQYPSREYLLECFDFREVADEHSDRNIHLFWKERPLSHFKNSWGMNAMNSRQAGKRAGSINVDKSGRIDRRVKIEDRSYLESRIIYIAMIDETFFNSNLEVDHKISEKTLDNSLENLRVANHLQNVSNRGVLKSNTSGYLGVSWSNRLKKWVAQINLGNKKKHLGVFEDVIKAGFAYDTAVREKRGEFARLNFSIVGSGERALHYLSEEKFNLLGGAS